MLKTIKYRLYPDITQMVLLNKTFGCTRLIYNLMLGDKIDAYQIYDVYLNPLPAWYKEKYQFLKEVDSLALANAQLNLNKAYNTFFKTKKGFPKFKCKHKSRDSYTTNNQNGTVTIAGNHLKLPKFKEPIKVKLHRKPPKDGVIKNVTVSKTKSGKYYVSVLFELPDQVITPKTVTEASTIGLDYASNGLYVDSNNNMPSYPRFYRLAEEQLARAQQRLSQKVLGSNNRYKAKLKLARLSEKVANQRKDFLHKLSRELVTNYSLICLEDLDLRAMSQSLTLGKSTIDNGFGMFRQYIEYKSKETGGQVVYINKWYPSSKTCHNCGYINEGLKLSDREWDCDCCGSHLDRDYNAAQNIKSEGLRLATV